MNSLKKAFRYANSKLIYLLLFGFLPAAFCSACFPISKIINFICWNAENPAGDFKSILFATSHIADKWWWIPLAMFLLAVLSYCMLFGAIDRHMRIGSFTMSFKRFSARANYNMLSATLFSVAVILCFVLDEFVFASLATLSSNVFSGATLTVALSFSAFLSFALLALAVALLIMWVPTMMHTGLNASAAFGMSVRQLGRDYWNVALSLAAVGAVALVLYVINGVLKMHIGVFLDMVFYCFVVVYYLVLAFTLFFEKNGIERMDLKKTSIWEK